MTDSRIGPDPTTEHLDPQVFVTYLDKTRWFGGKGRPFEVTDVRRLGTLGDDPGPHPRVVVLLVELTYADVAAGTADAVELYQVPLALYTDAERRLDHAFIGWWDEPGLGWVHAYDALHDRQAMALWLAAFGRAGGAGQNPTVVNGLEFHRVPGHDLDLEGTSALFTGEQSNSSVAFGEDSVMKVFRKVTPGLNPDVTTHEALTRAASEDVASLYGWVAHPPAEAGTAPLHLAMLQQFLRTATDGWDLALGSVRNLLADEGIAAREAGGDFAGESSRLGLTLREVHKLLAEHFEVGTTDATRIARGMSDRLTAAMAVAPALAQHEASLRAVYSRLADLGEVATQRVHGDLHLGQTLRTALGWKIVDFEGEPAKPLADRMLPDSPWRDVAGMLRSFDYAAEAVARAHGEGEDTAERDADRIRSAEWTARNQRYFLGAYVGTTDGSPLTSEQQVLVDAYTADKAVYELVYDIRNRPTWAEIPLAAISRIGAR